MRWCGGNACLRHVATGALPRNHGGASSPPRPPPPREVGRCLVRIVRSCDLVTRCSNRRLCAHVAGCRRIGACGPVPQREPGLAWRLRREYLRNHVRLRPGSRCAGDQAIGIGEGKRHQRSHMFGGGGRRNGAFYEPCQDVVAVTPSVGHPEASRGHRAGVLARASVLSFRRTERTTPPATGPDGTRMFARDRCCPPGQRTGIGTGPSVLNADGKSCDVAATRCRLIRKGTDS
jgi:hypothetical protein